MPKKVKKVKKTLNSREGPTGKRFTKGQKVGGGVVSGFNPNGSPVISMGRAPKISRISSPRLSAVSQAQTGAVLGKTLIERLRKQVHPSATNRQLLISIGNRMSGRPTPKAPPKAVTITRPSLPKRKTVGSGPPKRRGMRNRPY